MVISDTIDWFSTLKFRIIMKFGKKRTYCGKNHDEMMNVLSTLCEIEDRVELTDSEQEDFDIAVQCVTTVLNRMVYNKKIDWD